MGEEVDKIYIELKKYEVEIGGVNKKLQAIYDANVRFYQDLVKYILAGEQGLAEMDAYLAQMQSDLAPKPGRHHATARLRRHAAGPHHPRPTGDGSADCGECGNAVHPHDPSPCSSAI